METCMNTQEHISPFAAMATARTIPGRLGLPAAAVAAFALDGRRLG
jgi:hypothetical protein